RGRTIMNIDCVFSGGGIKAYAFLGSLKSINDKKYRIQRVAGTSAGAIIAALIAAKYTIKEIENMLDQLDIEKLLDPPLISKYIPMTRWALLYRNKGLYKGDKLEEWLEEKLRSEERRVGKECRSEMSRYSERTRGTGVQST